MNCQRFEDVVGDLARGQMMETYVRSTALSHSKDCIKCGQRLRDEQALMQALQALSVQMMPVSVSSEVETRLRKAMCRTPGVQLVVVTKTRRAYWLAIAAAVLLFVGTIVAINWQRHPRRNPDVAIQPPATDREPQRTDHPKENPTIAVNNDDRKTPKRVVRRPRSNAASRQTQRDADVVSNHAREVATEFIPLGYVNTVDLQDGGHIVRVELPRSALVSFGLPVNMDRVNEKLKLTFGSGLMGWPMPYVSCSRRKGRR